MNIAHRNTARRRFPLMDSAPFFVYGVTMTKKKTTVKEEAPAVEIDTAEYEAHHGKAPVWNQKGNWHFYVPRQYGRRPWLFMDVSYKEACDELAGKAHSGGVFRLAP